MLTHIDPQKKFNLNIKYLGWHIYQKRKKVAYKNTFNEIFSHLGAKNENHEYVAAKHVHKHIKSYSKMFVSFFNVFYMLRSFMPLTCHLFCYSTHCMYVCRISSCICANKFFMKSLITNAIYHSVCVSVGWCSNRIIHTQMQIWCFVFRSWK